MGVLEFSVKTRAPILYTLLTFFLVFFTTHAEEPTAHTISGIHDDESIVINVSALKGSQSHPYTHTEFTLKVQYIIYEASLSPNSDEPQWNPLIDEVLTVRNGQIQEGGPKFIIRGSKLNETISKLGTNISQVIYSIEVQARIKKNIFTPYKTILGLTTKSSDNWSPQQPFANLKETPVALIGTATSNENHFVGTSIELLIHKEKSTLYKYELKPHLLEINPTQYIWISTDPLSAGIWDHNSGQRSFSKVEKIAPYTYRLSHHNKSLDEYIVRIHRYSAAIIRSDEFSYRYYSSIRMFD